MKLVPTLAEGHKNLPNGETYDFDDTRFFPLLFGGDQLTAARIRGAQVVAQTLKKCIDRFEGVVPVIEDWHCRLTLMKV